MSAPARSVMPALQERIRCFVDSLIADETFNADEEEWQFSDGTASAVCTSSAIRIARAFKGQVFGYWSKSNPTAEIGGALSGGHDFALIRSRWLVDYWSFHVARIIPSPTLDLASPADNAAARRLYGDAEKWQCLNVS